MRFSWLLSRSADRIHITFSVLTHLSFSLSKTALQVLHYFTGTTRHCFRWTLVRMALEQRGTRSPFLHQTESMKSLDRTEKGMVNYFLGMTFCKLFAPFGCVP